MKESELTNIVTEASKFITQGLNFINLQITIFLKRSMCLIFIQYNEGGKRCEVNKTDNKRINVRF